tara:strand:+ start:180 stop:386 length:207 start_codon:yes stop_codon:yes gene_type:complete
MKENDRSLVKRPTEEWCAWRDHFGLWQKGKTKNSLMIPDRTQVKLFKTEEELDEFMLSGFITVPPPKI